MKKFLVFCLVVALIGGLVYGGYYLYNNTDLLDHFFRISIHIFEIIFHSCPPLPFSKMGRRFPAAPGNLSVSHGFHTPSGS